MNFKKTLFILSFTVLLLNSCKNDDNPASTDNTGNRAGYDYLPQGDKMMVDELNRHISKIEDVSPSSSNSDMSPLNYFSNKKIIGLGEATHGTKEFFQMKHKIFKYLVERYNYKVFGFEADMGECIYIDRFICKGIGTIEETIRKMHFGIWRTEEVKELILWMREYNRAKSPQDKIHFLGFDAQYWDLNSDLQKDFILNAGIPIPGYIERILGEIKALSSISNEDSLANKYSLFYTKCDSVRVFLRENKSQLIASSSGPEFEQIDRLMIQTSQAINVRTRQDVNKRDYYMAQNAQWMSNLYGSDSKIVIWAHNAHITKIADYPVSSFISNSMGNYLSGLLGNNYANIGFSFGNGSFHASTSTNNNIVTINQQKKESSNYIFGFAKYEHFLLINDNVPGPGILADFLGTKRLFFGVGATYYEDSHYHYADLTDCFDAIIHLSNTTASEYIPK